jgi:type II secretory pathway pseudopilin PulG
VIAIIGILASVVIASLASARIKSKDAAIKHQMDELVTILNLSHSDIGTFSNIAGGYYPGGPCSSLLTSGNYVDQATAICNNLMDKAAPLGINPNQKMFVGLCQISGCVGRPDVTSDKDFSFVVGLNNGQYYCVGSSGKSVNAVWTGAALGCTDNP